MRIDLSNLPKDHIGLPKRADLLLKLGEVLDAKILKIHAERALLLLKGQNILADVKTNLKPGDTLKVRVTGEFQNQIVLKVLNEGTNGTNPMEQLLRSNGFKPDMDTRGALTFLLKNGLPVTPETLQSMITDKTKTLDQLLTKVFLPQELQNPETNQKQPNPIKAMLDGLLNKDTPSIHNKAILPQDEKVNHPANSVTNRQAEGTTENAKTTANSGLPTKESAAAKAQISTGEFPRLGSNPDKMTNPINDTAGKSNPEQTASHKPTVGQQNVDARSTAAPVRESVEQLLKAVMDRQNASSIESSPGGGKGLNRTESQEPISKITSFERNASPEAKLPNSAATEKPTPAAVFTKLEQSGLILNPARNLPQLVHSLKQLVQNFGLGGKEDPTQANSKPNLSSLLPEQLGEEQREGLREISEKMLSFKLHQRESGVLLHLELPMLFNQQLTSGLLQIRDEAENSSDFAREDRPLSILFRLNTDDLGQLKVLVLLRDNDVSCQFSADREETRTLLRKSTAELKQRFEALSYEVSHMGVLPLIEEEVTPEPLPGQVDFRV